MTSRLPSRRFREVQLLIGAALVMLVLVVVAQVEGIKAMTTAAEEEARGGADATSRALAALAAREGASAVVGVAPPGVRLAVLGREGVELGSGEHGPGDEAWWPWASRQEWEAGGREVAGPLRLAGVSVVVACQPLPAGRVLRVVAEVTSASLVRQWRLLAGVLALSVAGGGALVAWLLLGRALAPYRELLAEATKLGEQPPFESEDRFLVATFRDTVRRLEESKAALRQRASELAVLAEVLTRESSSGVIVCEVDGSVRAANQVASSLVGPDLAVGTALPPVLTGEDERLRLGDKPVELRRFPLRSPDGEPQGEVVYLADQSERETLERALREREEMATLGELSAGMAHELRNALATIRGYLRLLAAADETQRHRYLSAMGGEADSLAEVVDRFLSFAQPRELQKEQVDLARLVREVVEKVGTTFPHLLINVEGPGETIAGDRLALTVVLENLLRNAAEALEGTGGQAWVHVEPHEGEVLIVVEDDGPGVSEEVLDRLFLPFVSSKPSGGLGLALARRLARLHGGEVTYTPRQDGGSLFTISLPRRWVS